MFLPGFRTKAVRLAFRMFNIRYVLFLGGKGNLIVSVSYFIFLAFHDVAPSEVNSNVMCLKLR